jgi:hypothetical protein
MTALQVIIKEAKAIRSKNPKMEWKKAIAQASAIYASKHKGKSPIGKKHAVKKKAAKKKVNIKALVKSKPTNPKYHLHNMNTKENMVSFSNMKDAKEFLDHFKEKGLNVKITSVKKVGAVKKYATKKAKKKPSEKAVLKSIKHAVSVQKSHMSSIGSHTIDRLKDQMSLLNKYQSFHDHYLKMPIKERPKLEIKKLKSLIKETKTHISQLKKHI